MTEASESDERLWEADKRDFVADCREDAANQRDEAADTREAIADDRDRRADQREAEQDERERLLNARAKDEGAGADDVEKHRALRAQRRNDATARSLAADERQQRWYERAEAGEARREATKRREAATPATGLALAFAEIARYFMQAENFEQILNRIVEGATATVSGCDMASVTVRAGGAYRTEASTHPSATSADEAQYEAQEGPCLDAIDARVVYTPSFPDPRWPRLAGRPAESGVRAAVSYQLCAPDPSEPLMGSLNAYASTPRAFDAEAREIGLILAAHGSVAIKAVRERAGLERLGGQLHEALLSRDVIGQAKGILMERLRLTPEDAFDALRRSSQQLNLKLREIAQRLAETGEWDADPQAQQET